MDVASVLSVLNLAAAAVSWLRERRVSDPGELVFVAVESLIDEAIAAGFSIEQARELFVAGGLSALRAIGVPEMLADSLSKAGAAHGVRALRKRVSALAFARAARSLPDLETAANRAVEAFSSSPVVEVRPEDVRIERVPWQESSSADEGEPASPSDSDGLPPLPPLGPLGRKG